jgi:hypothetical protein
MHLHRANAKRIVRGIKKKAGKQESFSASASLLGSHFALSNTVWNKLSACEFLGEG